MKPWTSSIDPSTIPDDVLRSEWARRSSAKRKTFGAGTGRPKKLTPCGKCGAMLGVAEKRKHSC